MVPEALAAVDPLKARGVLINVFNVTGPGPLFTQFQRAAVGECLAWKELLDELVPESERSSPVVTVCDAHPHSLSWIGGALGTRVWPLGVTKFGQSGSLSDVYRLHQIDTDSIIKACLTAVKPTRNV
jgi:pyruvate dehydrogenase E1 component